ncbi:MAG: hypothetical protein ACK53L_05020, partial [Pirellulaceae bacterium]
TQRRPTGRVSRRMPTSLLRMAAICPLHDKRPFVGGGCSSLHYPTSRSPSVGISAMGAAQDDDGPGLAAALP